jgi:hypothetical protein
MQAKSRKGAAKEIRTEVHVASASLSPRSGLCLFINILDLLIISNAMSFFLNFYENFKFLFFKWF